LISSYEPKNIYNADETGFFFGHCQQNHWRGKELSCDTKDFVQNDDHQATHYSFEPATALLAVRNTQNEDVEEEGEGGEKAAGEQDISTKIHTH
jgi:hypothetical protein